MTKSVRTFLGGAVGLDDLGWFDPSDEEEKLAIEKLMGDRTGPYWNDGGILQAQYREIIIRQLANGRFSGTLPGQIKLTLE